MAKPLPVVMNLAPRALKRVIGIGSRVSGAVAPPPSQLISRRPSGWVPGVLPLLAPPRSARNWSTTAWIAAALAPDPSRTTGPAIAGAAPSTPAITAHIARAFITSISTSSKGCRTPVPERPRRDHRGGTRGVSPALASDLQTVEEESVASPQRSVTTRCKFRKRRGPAANLHRPLRTRRAGRGHRGAHVHALHVLLTASALALVLLIHIAPPAAIAAAAADDGGAAAVVANDNRRPAGSLDAGTLSLALRAGRGRWSPEPAHGPALDIEAFGEVGQPLMVPAPLLRVAEGTTVAVSVTNELAAPLRVHGLCSRDGSPCAPLDVPPGGDARGALRRRPRRHLSLLGDDPGRAGALPRARRRLHRRSAGRRSRRRSGAGHHRMDQPDADDLRQIFSADDIGEAFIARQPSVAFMLNGLGWPATERLTYRLGEPVRWRVLNLSSQPHPMHLHGFYFDVERLGDGRRDAPAAAAQPRRVVTQLLPPGGTLTMTWTPERPGNWLFHCHLMEHVSPLRRLPAERRSGDHHEQHGHHADAVARDVGAGPRRDRRRRRAAGAGPRPPPRRRGG